MMHICVRENCSIFNTPTHLVHLRPKFFHPLDLVLPISNEPLLSLSLSLSPNDSQSIKKNIMQGWLFTSSGSSFRSAFVFSINSLILSRFPLTSFHLAEASLSAFPWLYSLVCAAIQKYHEMSFFYNYSHF